MENINYNWGIVGCGSIANEFAKSIKQLNKNIYGIYNRTFEKAYDFSKQYDIENIYDTAEDMFCDENIDIVYISTPHNKHIEYIKMALSSGKHVLCEKAITLNSFELREAVELANKNNLILAEAMTIYNMPIYKRLTEIIDSGILGKLNLIQANFGSYKEYDMNNRFFSMYSAGGALLDIGVYAISLARSFMTSSPNCIKSFVKFSESGVDERASIIMNNLENEMASITISLHTKQPKRVVIAFEKGYIEIYDYPRGNKATIFYTESGEKEEVIEGNSQDALIYEILNMENSVQNGVNLMKLDYTIDVMNIMTNLRKEWKLIYPEEILNNK